MCRFGNWITFGPLRITCLFRIWTTLLIIVDAFAVVIISLHIRKCALLLHLAWLNSKKLGFTFFLLYSHKGWTASLVCDSVYSVLDSGWLYFLLSLCSTVNCTSATSYNCNATITFFLIPQQWITSDAITTNISFSASALNILSNYLESECGTLI